MNDLSRPEPAALTDATPSVREMRARVEAFKPGSEGADALVEETIALLQSLPFEQYVDERVDLAFTLTFRVLSPFVHCSQTLRLARAAWPAGAKLRDGNHVRRWWLLVGTAEQGNGNVPAFLEAMNASLEAARRIGNGAGQASVLVNLTLAAGGAGRYEEVLRLTERAAILCRDATEPYAWEPLRAATINRANALFRLGRLEEAVKAYAVGASLSLVENGPRVAKPRIQAILMLAEIHLRLGDTGLARAFLRAARGSSAPGVDCSPSFARVEGLLAIADGRFDQGVAQIKAALASCPRSTCDDEAFDALHALERAHREHGFVTEADGYLQRIGDEMAGQAGRLLDGLRAVPAVAEYAQIDSRLQQAAGHVNRSFDHLMATASSQSSLEEPSGEHGLRVACLARLLAQAAGLEAREVEAIERGALVHDVGLIGVPSKVVSKREDLSDAEQKMYDAHAEIGSDLVERARFDGRQTALNIVRYHHVAFDGVGGSGAPVMRAIPLEARIVALCDAFDELITGKPRQAAVSVPEAMRRLLGRRGRDFDPHLTDLLIDIVRRLASEQEDLKAHLSSEADDIQYFAAQRALRRATAGISKETSPP